MIDWWVPYEMNEIKKKHFYQVYFAFLLHKKRKRTIIWSHCNVWLKMDFLRQLTTFQAVVGLKSKKIHPCNAALKAVYSYCLVQGKWNHPLQLHESLRNHHHQQRSIVRKSMKYTKNWNVNIWYFSILKKNQLLSTSNDATEIERTDLLKSTSPS